MEKQEKLASAAQLIPDVFRSGACGLYARCHSRLCAGGWLLGSSLRGRVDCHRRIRDGGVSVALLCGVSVVIARPFLLFGRQIKSGCSLSERVRLLKRRSAGQYRKKKLADTNKTSSICAVLYAVLESS